MEGLLDFLMKQSGGDAYVKAEAARQRQIAVSQVEADIGKKITMALGIVGVVAAGVGTFFAVRHYARKGAHA